MGEIKLYYYNQFYYHSKYKIWVKCPLRDIVNFSSFCVFAYKKKKKNLDETILDSLIKSTVNLVWATNAWGKSCFSHFCSERQFSASHSQSIFISLWYRLTKLSSKPINNLLFHSVCLYRSVLCCNWDKIWLLLTKFPFPGLLFSWGSSRWSFGFMPPKLSFE